ncbi:hypothetical protein [Hoeflea sp.]|uniref:hypothetical protein n=1 Tax=Hoeflea sp. TaxID=1940281 RepID=UPI003749928C
MEKASVEIENSTGAGGVIVARFETAAEAVGTVHIAGGSKQKFDEFDRLTVSAPDAAGHLRLFNHSPWPFDLMHQTKSGHTDNEQIEEGCFHDLTIAPGDQLYIVPHPPVFSIPDQPLLYLAHFRPQHPRPPFAPNQKPSNMEVYLEWSHPMQGHSELWGYNVYRSVYEANRQISLDCLNGVPQMGTSAHVLEVRPPQPFNHRYAITAVNREGIESLFSNIRILDWRTAVDLYDAGFVPL